MKATPFPKSQSLGFVLLIGHNPDQTYFLKISVNVISSYLSWSFIWPFFKTSPPKFKGLVFLFGGGGI
jgi:hypothetical protein